MATGASSVLGEAITSLSKATLAIAETEGRARRDVAKAASEADGFRRERDAATSALHASQREAHAHKIEADAWKAKAEQVTMALKHAREITEGVRREAEQWKDQYTRLEKARARQEEGLLVQIEEWRDQYRRVEKERSRLSVKLEELMIHRSRVQPPSTPQHTLPDELSASTSSAVTKVSKSRPPQSNEGADRSLTAVEEPEQPRRKPARRSTPARPRVRPRAVPDDEDEEDEAQLAHPPRPATAPARKSAIAESAHGAQPRETQLIRRVRAVISIPVKQEDDALGVESGGLFDSGLTESTASRSLSISSTSRSATRVHPPRPAKTKSGRVVRPAPNRLSRDGGYAEDDYDEGDGGVMALADVGDSDGDEDYEARERSRGRKKLRRESEARPRRKSPIVEEDEEDDELMIGAEEDHHEVYGSSRIDDNSASAVQPAASSRPSGRKTHSSGTKRKNPSVAATGEHLGAHKAKR